MNLLQQYMPSLDRMFGNNLSHIRESCQLLIVTLDGVQNLLDTRPSKEEVTRCFDTAISSACRHFEREARHMFNVSYDCVDTHIEKHMAYVNMLDVFQLRYMSNNYQENMKAFNELQRWLSVHLLMDDAHFIAQASKK